MGRFDYMKPISQITGCVICTKETLSDKIICYDCAKEIRKARIAHPENDWSLRLCNACLSTGYAETPYYKEYKNKFECRACRSTNVYYFTYKELIDKGVI